jgi:hypothetical protein
MNALRLFFATAVVATLSAPLAGVAAPQSVASATSCSTPSRSTVERRIAEQAARGLPALIGFVHRTQPIYQLTVVDAVAWIDSERERRAACLRASVDRLAD